MRSLWKTGKNVPARRSDFEDPFAAMRRAMDSFFGEALDRPALWERPGAYWPSVNLKETDDHLEVSAELPGMNEDDVELTLTDNNLVIKGEKKFEREGDEKDYHFVERSYGSFHRSIPLPYEVDRESVAATFDKGVLKVDLKKSTQARENSRRINIKTR